MRHTHFVKAALALSVILLTGVGVGTIHARETGRAHYRTLVNQEMAPFFYVILERDSLHRDSHVDVVHQRLREQRHALRMIAPGNMVPLRETGALLLGYYGGEASSLALRAVLVDLHAEGSVVRIDRRAVMRSGGQPVILSRWEIPAPREPVVVGMGEEQWEGGDILFTGSPVAVPMRSEDLRTGAVLTPEETRFWRVGGTAIRRIVSQGGADGWFLRIQADPPVLDNTGYHFPVFRQGAGDSEENSWRYQGELAVVIRGTAGPVVWVAENGAVHWAGQYLERNGAVELHIDREVFDSLEDREEIRLDVATSHRNNTATERFTLGSFNLTAERW